MEEATAASAAGPVTSAAAAALLSKALLIQAGLDAVVPRFMGQGRGGLGHSQGCARLGSSGCNNSLVKMHQGEGRCSV